MSSQPRIAISVGDVAGVGPELALKCAALPEITERCTPVLYGPLVILKRIATLLKLALPKDIVDVGDAGEVSHGHFSLATGQASFDAFNLAISDAMSGKVAGVVTGPIQKQAWHLAGIPFPGHTEVLAERTGTDDFCMMLTSREISCVLTTIHVPLADVPSMLTTDLVIKAITLANEAMTKRHGRPGRIVVCGLNPHAGENGLFSHGEEQSIIIPAVDFCHVRGMNVVGPVPPDTAFTPSMRAKTDAYVCMYHDQGLIPLKALSFDDAVNVTLGLPIVRTSVDHGTAMDLAWQGTANHQSMVAAIDMAVDLSCG
ncbi:4-hydroxythreonine-4-phosphate dehydrogenase [Rubripirellula amarantea]|uniref:4-hydroxythreonine-4-phosphate dehydrogenase n=1 Tax=Rubripirellula amarantea TaxID=2527999 RepID=A0A5C5WXD0_9BACT|nr:4-hydroxythreonine-4-phosphate dehydrogenase PdxA [Rubripirellula amarantea]TWT54545.1 4-hydroxythreonine-4-phosphate dehydrogenase [Rubripirellula amarantea]